MDKQTAAHAIEARGIKKNYYQGALSIPVLKGVDLIIDKGEFAALLGPSGSGKSTLLHILGLMDHPNEGEVILAGQSTRGLDELRRSELRNRHLGFVFQFDSLLPEFTTLENLLMPGRIAGAELAPLIKRAKGLLDHLQIGHLENRMPQEMSGGERQRVAIARALVNNPAIIMADEPTGNLDRRSGELVFSSLKEVAESFGVAVILVTHNEYATKFASRVLHLSDGAITESITA